MKLNSARLTTMLSAAAMFVVASTVRALSLIVAQSDQSALADPREWSSILLFKTPVGACTATVIGPRVLLTAAYCIGDKNFISQGSVADITGRIDYQLKCDVAINSDLAFCRTNVPLPSRRIERVIFGRNVLAVSTKVNLVGYGCRDAVTLEFDGRLSIGNADVLGPAPDGKLIKLRGSTACPGDGGGPVFQTVGSQRSVVGIIISSDRQEGTWVAPVNAPELLSWTRGWATNNAVSVCGVSPDTANACGAAATPPVAAQPLTTAYIRSSSVTLAKATFAPVVAANATAEGLSSNDQTQIRQISFRKGEILADVVLLSCVGAADETYLTRALEHLARNGISYTRDYRFEQSGTIEVPICPNPANQKDETIVVVREGGPSSLWTFYSRLVENPEFAKRWAYELRAGESRISPAVGRESRYFVEVFQALNPIPGLDVNNLKPGEYRLPLRPKTGGELAVLPPIAQSFEPIGALQYQEQNCAKQQDLLSYPYDVAALLDVLAANAERRGRQIAAPATVVIVDSGLYAAGRSGSPFRGDMLYRFGNWMGQQERDRFLTKLEPRLPNPEAQAHGTWVASLVLGGPLFARMLTNDTGGSRILIDPYPLYEARGQNGKVILPADAFTRMIEHLTPSATGRTIVNLSLRTKEDLPSISNQLGGSHPNFLFVVAAGNGQGSGNDIRGQQLAPKGDRSSYPASYGGPDNAGRTNLITVAALFRDSDGIWQRAGFSDYGSAIVEVGAPGCAIPVLQYDPDEQRWSPEPRFVSGTSFSAPLVSFTAAMLSAEYRDLTAPQIKQRILAAADLNPQLIQYVTDGRALNIVKALTVFHDVIQTQGQLLRGTLDFRNRDSGASYDWNQELPNLQCYNYREPITLMDILKIVPAFNVAIKSEVADKFPDRIYIGRGQGEQPYPLDCRLPDDLVVYFKRHGSDVAPPYAWQSLQDIVPRIPSARSQ